MKLRRFAVQNVRSFLSRAELRLDGDIAVLIGPNGGGKTNLLDAITTTVRNTFLHPYTIGPAGNPLRQTVRRSERFSGEVLEKHVSGADQDTVIEIDLEVTSRDLHSMATLADLKEQIDEFARTSDYQNFTTRSIDDFAGGTLNAGDRLSYLVTNGDIRNELSPSEQAYLAYLQYFEVLNTIKSHIDHRPLTSPFAYFSVNRAQNDIPSSIAVANYNDAEAKRSVDHNWSRAASSMSYLALGRIFDQKRMSLEPVDSTHYVAFDADGSLANFTDTLRSLGYDWDIKTLNPRTNEYEFRLVKSGVDFNIARASSGEKELLTYVLAIYGLNLRDALIIVDEPELHLHPRWQRSLLELFERLTKDTGNQFVTATHSPSFISPKSISYVSRVHVEKSESRITKLSDTKLPNQKHLLALVNSQNNEKIFFADRVVLVEGISD